MGLCLLPKSSPLMIYGLVLMLGRLQATHALYVIKSTMIVIEKTSRLCSETKMA